jgi:hypothetical protein
MRNEKQRRPIRWGRIVLIFIALLLFGRVILYSVETVCPPLTSLTFYLKFSSLDGWLTDEPYPIFPAKEAVKTANSHQYLHKTLTSPTFLFDNDVLTYLRCSYSSDAYDAEIERLTSLCGEPTEEGWELPAYVLTTYFPNWFSTYALVDAQQQTIHYFSVQGTMVLEQYIPSNLYHEEQAKHIQSYREKLKLNDRNNRGRNEA